MKGLVVLLVVLAVAGGVSGCGTKEASEVSKHGQEAVRLIKENDAKLKEVVKKLKAVTTHTTKSKHD